MGSYGKMTLYDKLCIFWSHLTLEIKALERIERFHF